MNDLLKREKVLRTIQKMFECCDTYDIIDYRDLMIEAIKVLPPERQVNINRPQGEWIVNISDYKSICSICGANEAHFIYGTEMWYGLGKSKFCPYCGARMKGAKRSK